MAIDVRQIGGIKANDSSDSALIAALDSRYGNSLGGSGGATVLPTFNSTNTVIFGSPGVSITPASTGSSTYNVQLGLPASLENVTGGSGSLSPSSTPTLTFDNSSGIETVSSGNGGLTISLKSGQTTDYYVNLKLPTSLFVGGSSAVSVGTTLNKGNVTFSSVADSYGVFPESTSANTYNLNLVLPNGATVTGTGGSGNGGGGLQDITFNTVPAEYTASPATNAKVSIGGTGTSRNVKLILPATASMSGGNGGTPANYVTSINVGTKDRFATQFDIEFKPTPLTGAMDYTCNISLPGSSIASGAVPTNVATELDWNNISLDLDGTSGMALKKNTKYGFSCPKIQATYSLGNGSAATVPCYGIWLKTKGQTVGDSDSATINGNTYSGENLQACRDAGVGFFLADGTNANGLIGACEFRVVYSFTDDDKLHGFKLFDLYDHDLSGAANTGRNAVFIPWIDVGTMNVQTFANGLASYDVADEGFVPLTVNLTDARSPGANVAQNTDGTSDWHFTSSGNGYSSGSISNLYYYLLMMKRKDRNSSNKTAYGGFGINSAGDPIFLTCVVDSSTGKAQMSAGKISVSAYTDILGSK